jgi:hypothetical protein
MIPTSDSYNKIIVGSGRKFYSGAHVMLKDGTELDLDKRNLMSDGGFQIEDSVSDTDVFQV